MVPVRNNSCEIKICIDFQNMNEAYEKYNYPFPPMEQILQIVSSFEMFSLLDWFLGYYQVLITEPN
jgi:hypothetical protein